ncbi:hypothetical protein B0O99DRAFT_477940, partial [Bisporella sp. PMI_857]
MTFTYRNGVSVAELIVYVPCLAVALLLMFRHGFAKSAGWYFLVIFTLARIIGPCMQLATISDPTNVSLYTGYTILQNVALSPLQLAALGLLSRLLESINKSKHTLLNTRMLKFIELVVLVGLILGIVGGINAGSDYQTTGIYKVSSLSKTGTILFAASYIAIVAFTLIISFSISHAEAGEKRILVAIASSLPFILVRLIYSIMSAFSHNKHFSIMNGSVTVLLCVALVEELIVVLIYETMGLTLRKVVKAQEGYDMEGGHQQVPSSDSRD